MARKVVSGAFSKLHQSQHGAVLDRIRRLACNSSLAVPALVPVRYVELKEKKGGGDERKKRRVEEELEHTQRTFQLSAENLRATLSHERLQNPLRKPQTKLLMTLEFIQQIQIFHHDGDSNNLNCALAHTQL
jgi:hypothetical protein